MTELNQVLQNFYTTDRLSLNMSDEGGPFGFDIHFALEVDYLLKAYNCDAFIETGTNAGDTTDYMSKMYPDISIISSEIDFVFHALAKERLKDRNNVQLFLESSEKTVKRITDYKMPFYYLDAHWGEYWPIFDELVNIERGIICVGDFFIGKQAMESRIHYMFDSYNGVNCDKDLILSRIKPDTPIYVNNNKQLDKYPAPSLQMRRRSGRCYFCKNIEIDHMKDSDYFVKI